MTYTCTTTRLTLFSPVSHIAALALERETKLTIEYNRAAIELEARTAFYECARQRSIADFPCSAETDNCPN